MFKFQSFPRTATVFPALFRRTNHHQSLPQIQNATTIVETLTLLLKQRQKLPQISQIHAQVTTQGLSSNSSLVFAIVRCYISAKNLSFARTSFDRCLYPSLLLWNVIIQAYSKKQNCQESFNLFRQMLALGDGSMPDKYTFTFVITSCSQQNTPIYGDIIHALVIKFGCESDTFVCNSLLNFYSVFGKMEEARIVFEEMPQKDVVTWTSFLSGYTKHGKMDRAVELFSEMPERTDVSWTVMISGLVGVGACAYLGALDQGKWIRSYVEKIETLRSANISTALIDMYAKCGKIDCARSIFNGSSKTDVFTWTSMISALSKHGLGEHALSVFSQMPGEGIKPDDITLLGVLNGCSHSGLVEEGCSVFDKMETLWGISPMIQHYGCMVDLLGRAGQLERAFEFVRRMPIEPDIVIWRALLSSCRIHRNVKLGEQIIDHISQSDPCGQGGGYVLLSNLYASLGRWEKVDGVRKQMNAKNIELRTGCSWIENGTVHKFVSADKLHPRITEIHQKLNQVLKKARTEGGYITNTNPVLFDLSDEEKEQAVSWHSEKLAVAFGLLSTHSGAPIMIVKNLRICDDCHSAMKAISRVFSREITVRDRSRFHNFREGICSCKDYW
ncbi:pentatricopeptide repeat-containing protein At3g62890-like [Papaver somniferum]|uniref:pentatricopeptide repeat-containing protein At3g62890-like n=1 Tax=Papaver somniferum TaxID=3469 RepID=UPI000E6F7B71|nr:pentatricopeptide repeat-containing protein At3g62890-like [Papaver somniferum]